MVSIALLHKDLPHYKDFLGENKEGTFGSYEKFSRIKIDRIRTPFVRNGLISCEWVAIN